MREKHRIKRTKKNRIEIKLKGRKKKGEIDNDSDNYLLTKVIEEEKYYAAFVSSPCRNKKKKFTKLKD